MPKPFEHPARMTGFRVVASVPRHGFEKFRPGIPDRDRAGRDGEHRQVIRGVAGYDQSTLDVDPHMPGQEYRRVILTGPGRQQVEIVSPRRDRVVGQAPSAEFGQHLVLGAATRYRKARLQGRLELIGVCRIAKADDHFGNRGPGPVIESVPPGLDLLPRNPNFGPHRGNDRVRAEPFRKDLGQRSVNAVGGAA